MSFPDPPIYTKYYTSDAVKNGTAPPPPPIPKKFKVFGEDYDLEAVRITFIFPFALFPLKYCTFSHICRPSMP